MRPDGTAFRWLTDCAPDAPVTTAPEWGPDGRRMLLLMDGEPAIMRADGSRLHRVPLAAEPRSDAKPSFAPDGRRFAYTSTAVSGRSSSRIAAIDGTEDRRLRTGRDPIWSPSGRQIAFVRSGSGEDQTVQYSIWTLRLRDGRQKRIYATAPISLEEDTGPPSLSWQARPR